MGFGVGVGVRVRFRVEVRVRGRVKVRVSLQRAGDARGARVAIELLAHHLALPPVER